MSEHTEQAALMERVRLYTPRYPALGLVHATPNGGLRHKATAARLKAEGVRAGYPDLSLCVARQGYSAWHCEMKVKGGRLSLAQEEWIDMLRAYGNYVIVAYSQEAAWADLCWYLGIEE